MTPSVTNLAEEPSSQSEYDCPGHRTSEHNGPLAKWDFLILALLLIAWGFLVGPIVVDEHLHGYDIFREAGMGESIKYRSVLSDPAYPNASLWYPPLGTLSMAWIASVFGTSVEACFSWSQLLFNWLIPGGLFLVVRSAWGRRAGVFAALALLFAMPWWQCEVAHGQPSIHAVIIGFVSLAMIARAERSKKRIETAATGVFVGMTMWHHPLIPCFLMCLLTAHALWRSRTARPLYVASIIKLPSMQIVWIAALVGAPLLWQILHGPVRNDTPRTYFAAELRTIEFALMGGHPWILLVGILGIGVAVRECRSANERLVLALILAGIFQIPAYVRDLAPNWGHWLPTIVPHEFQRLFQLAWAIAVGIGSSHLIIWLCRRISNRGMNALLYAACAGFILFPGVLHTQKNLRRFLTFDYTEERSPATVKWILQNTDPEDVFICTSELAFQWLIPSTGRRAWILPPGHSNPRVDWLARNQVFQAMRNVESGKDLRDLCLAYELDYVISSGDWVPAALHEDNRAESVPSHFSVVATDATGIMIFEPLP
ncbi:MAG: hypothetical protein ACPGXK_14975 [Phycisphaerae bacterium]